MKLERKESNGALCIILPIITSHSQNMKNSWNIMPKATANCKYKAGIWSSFIDLFHNERIQWDDKLIRG